MVESGLAETRSQARALIMAGQVLADGQRVDKPGQQFAPEAALTLKSVEARYVSRGGLKLEGALSDFGLEVAGLKALDIGASTGGFTDCLLKHGAESVCSVDVGYGLIHWSLRQDPRVTVVERINARHLEPAHVGDQYQLAVIDVSFISLALILPPAARLVIPGARILALVKPQFEVGRDKVGRGGVVRNEADIAASVDSVAGVAENLGLKILGRAPSQLKGPKGNQEYFLLLERRKQ